MPTAAGRDDSSSERRVPTARYGETRTVFMFGATEEFGDLEVEQHAHQMSALMGAGDVARLILHPHAAVRAEVERIGEVTAATKRRRLKSVTIDFGNAGVESTDQRDEGLVGDPPVSRAVITVQEGAVGDEWLMLP